MKKNLSFAMFALALSGTSALQATSFNNAVGLAGVGVVPTATLTFDNAAGLSANSTITNQFAFAGVTFSSPAFYDGNSAGGGCGFNDFSGDCVTNYTSAPGSGLTSTPATPFSILFSLPQAYAAFALVTDNNGRGNTTIQAYKGNTFVDGSTFTTGSSGGQNATVPNFYGFYGTSGFDRITISTTGANLVILDNLQLQNIPEPGTIAMFSLGLGVVVTLARRRKIAQ